MSASNESSPPLSDPSGDNTKQMVVLRNRAAISTFVINDTILASREDALDYCRNLPDNERYNAYRQFDSLCLDNTRAFDALLELSYDDVQRGKLYQIAGMSLAQYQEDSWQSIAKVKQIRSQREKGLTRIQKLWGESEYGMMVAKSFWDLYGSRTISQLATIAGKQHPEDAVKLLNGELVRRLKKGSGRGRRINMRSYTPLDFENAVKVLKNDTWTEYVVTLEDLETLDLAYNQLGILGQQGPGFMELEPPKTDQIEGQGYQEMPIDQAEMSKLEERNLSKWSSFGIFFIDEAEPDIPCIMDKMIVRRNTVFKPGEAAVQEESESDDEPRALPKSCTCEDKEKRNLWYTLLDEGYVAKAVGWMVMVELVPRKPNNLCRYHYNRLANTLGLVHSYIPLDELGNRLNKVYRLRERIDVVRLESTYFTWFKPHRYAAKERKANMLGELRFKPNPCVMKLPEVKNKETFDKVGRAHYEELSWISEVAELWELAQSHAKMYYHHARPTSEVTNGFLHTSYFSPIQQLLRRDLFLWRKMAQLRPDHEFRLITIPEPLRYLLPHEEVNLAFTHGKLRGIYEDSRRSAAASGLVAYVIPDIGAQKKSNGQVYSLLAPDPKEDCRRKMKKAFEKCSLFDKSSWHDLSQKKNFKVFNAARTRQGFNWEEFTSPLTIVGPGIPLQVRSHKRKERTESLAITVAYASVSSDDKGKAVDKLANGMTYAELRESHLTLSPIFCNGITRGGKHVFERFPVDMVMPAKTPVERALVGQDSWDDPWVLDEAKRLLSLSEEDFIQEYTVITRDNVTLFQQISDMIGERERTYGEKSYLCMLDDDGPGEVVTDEEFTLANDDDPSSEAQPRDKGKGVDRSQVPRTAQGPEALPVAEKEPTPPPRTPTPPHNPTPPRTPKSSGRKKRRSKSAASLAASPSKKRKAKTSSLEIQTSPSKQ